MTNNETLSAFQLAEIFPDDRAAEIWLERLRWPSKRDIRCPSCGSDSIIDVVSRKPTPFRCRPCRFRFSVRKGTVLESTNVGLRKWIFAGYAFVTSPKGIASTKVAQDLGVSQPTARFMLHRLPGRFRGRKQRAHQFVRWGKDGRSSRSRRGYAWRSMEVHAL